MTKPKTVRFEESTFVERLREEGLKETSTRTYCRVLIALDDWCSSKGTNLDVVTDAELTAYLDDRPNKGVTHRPIVRTALRHYWRLSGRADWPTSVTLQAALAGDMKDETRKELRAFAAHLRESTDLSSNTISLYGHYFAKADAMFRRNGYSARDIPTSDAEAFLYQYPDKARAARMARALEQYWQFAGRGNIPILLGRSSVSTRAAKPRVQSFLGESTVLSNEEAVVSTMKDVMGFTEKTIKMYVHILRKVNTWCIDNGLLLETLAEESIPQLVAEVSPTNNARKRLRPALATFWEAIGRYDGPVNTIEVLWEPKPSKTGGKRRSLEERMSNSPNAQAFGRSLEFRAYLQQRLEMSDKTIRLYLYAFRMAEWWCNSEGYTLQNVPGELLMEFVEQRPKTWSIRRQMRSTFKHYWNFCERENPPLWAVRVPRKPRTVCRALTDEEALKLVEQAHVVGGQRELAVLLGMYQGLRREEIAKVTWDDIEREPGWLHILGKGDLPAKIPLHSVVMEAFERLRKTHGTWVFPAFNSQRAGGHVSPSTIWSWVVRTAEEAGVEGMTTHRLRHTCLAKANDETGDLRAVQDFARHSKPDTTAGYTRSTERRLRKVLAALDYSKQESDEPLPDISYDMVVTGTEGARNLWAWRDLGRALLAHHGWKFLVTDGLAYWVSKDTSIWATAWTSEDGAPIFTLWRSEHNDETSTWDFHSASELINTANSLLKGEENILEPTLRLGPWIEEQFLAGIRKSAVSN